MLEYLRIRGLAIAHDVQLELGAGLNVLSGETGAGKSIVVDALSLLRGARGRAALVRDGADALVVEGQFAVAPATRAQLAAGTPRPGAAPSVEGAAIATEEPDDTLVLARQVQASGRGRCRVHEGLVPLNTLRAVGTSLLDICGQHAHHGLIRGEQQQHLLDVFADSGEALAEYRRAHARWREAFEALASLRARAAASVQREDYLRFQMEELEAAAPVAGEYAELRSQLVLLREAERWRMLAQEVRHEAYEREGAAAEVLGGLAARASAGAEASTALAQVAEHLAAAQVACEEAAAIASSFLGGLEEGTDSLLAAETRIDVLDGLSHKHGCTPDALVPLAARLGAELSEIEDLDDTLAAARVRERAALGQTQAAALALRVRRRRAAARLEAAVGRELVALEMQAARLEIRVEPRCEDASLQQAPREDEDTDDDALATALGPGGADRVVFHFSANAGEGMAPLAKVASGGELSRVLLALKTVTHAQDPGATSVFDEIDTGVSGAAAQAIGARMAHVARSRQVMCVTHLPQLAAFADQHFMVEKYVEDGRTFCRVRQLDAAGRVEELARMIGSHGGAKTHKSARRHAKALLDEAKRRKELPELPFESEGEEEVKELRGGGARDTSGSARSSGTKRAGRKGTGAKSSEPEGTGGKGTGTKRVAARARQTNASRAGGARKRTAARRSSPATLSA